MDRAESFKPNQLEADSNVSLAIMAARLIVEGFFYIDTQYRRIKNRIKLAVGVNHDCWLNKPSGLI